MIIPFLSIQVQRLLAWNRRRKVLDEMRLNTRALDDIGLNLRQLEAEMRARDEAAIRRRSAG